MKKFAFGAVLLFACLGLVNARATVPVIDTEAIASDAVAVNNTPPDSFQINFIWKSPGQSDFKPSIRCLSKQEASIQSGSGKEALGLKVTAWYTTRISYALTLQARGHSFTTLLSEPNATLSFKRNAKGRLNLLMKDEKGNAIGDIRLDESCKDLEGSSLHVAVALVPPDQQKP